MTTIATIKAQVIGTDKAAKQLDQVGKATERVGRNQTRLGQASASAGRQFAAQSAGLGGLVQAYAGAAANIFAITAAFTALNRAAEFEQIIKGTQSLASSIGANGREIIASVQEITRSQLNLLETASTVNIGLAAGFNTDQINDLTEVSLRASKALGRSLTDAFTRVSRGAAKLEPELLDELGIFTRIDPAVKAYADSIGRSVSSLTNFERRQAFVNAVIAEGQRKFRDVDVTSKSAAVSLEQLAATIINLGLQFGSVLATAVAPLADFITGNLSNSIALFGLLAKQVGGLATAVLAAGIDKATQSFANLALTAATALNRINPAFAEATRRAAQYAESTKLLNFGNQLLRQQSGEVLRLVAAQQLKTSAELKGAKATLEQYRATILANIENKKYGDVTLPKANEQVKLLTNNIIKLAAAQKASSIGANVASAALAGLGRAIGFVGTALTRVIGFAFTFITVISLAQLALDGLAKAFGFEGFNILEKIINFIKELIDSLTVFSRSVKAFSSGLQSELRAAAAAAGAFAEDIDEAVEKANKKFLQVLKTVDKNLKGITGDRDVGPAIFNQQALGALEMEIRSLRESSPAAAAALEVLVERLVELGDGSIIVGLAFARLIDQISKLSGVATKDVSQIVQGFKELQGISFNATAEGLFIDGTQVARLEDGVLKINAGFRETISILTQGVDKVIDFDTQFKSGALNAERAAQAVGAINNVIIQANNEQERLNNQITRLNDKLESATQSEQAALRAKIGQLEKAKELLESKTRELEIEREIRASQASRLAEAEKELKIRDKIFGKAGEKLAQSRISGKLNPLGGVAQTPEQVETNQLLNLVQDLARARKREAEFTRANSDLLSKQRKEQENIKKLTEELNKLDQQDITTNARARELADQIAQAKNRENAIKGQIVSKDAKAAVAAQEQSQIIDIITAKRQQALSNEQKILNEFEKQNNALQSQNRQSQINLQLIQLQNEIKILEIQKKQQIGILERGKALKESFGTFFERDNIEFLREKMKVEIEVSSKTLERQKKIADQQEKATIEAAKQQRLNRDVTLLALRARAVEINRQAQLFKNFLQGLDTILKERFAELNPAGKVKSISEDTFAVDVPMGDVGVRVANQLLEAEKASDAIFDNIVKGARDTAATVKDIKTKENQLLKDSLQANFEIAQREATTRFKVYESFRDGTNETLKPALEGVFQSIADGTFTVNNLRGELNNFFRDLIENIRKKLLKETLIDPLSEGVTSSFKGAFFGGGSGGSQGNMFGNFFTGLFGGGGGKATGGLVHMAGGGQVRDRVPAMLEPGEFVIRRPMAKAIGGEALGAMNATGTMPTGEVTVNITNQGTPQEASASKPRFDGEKFVIDIVTRDLRNNGPIRKSLRGGA